MENGNYNGPEFSWEYSHGGAGHGQRGMSNYSQNHGGRQWLHSNQNQNSYQQPGMSGQGQGQGQFGSPPDLFADFNNSMMSKYGNYGPSGGSFSPAGGHGSMMHGGGHGMGSDMGNGMGGGRHVAPRMRGGYSGRGGGGSGRANGLGEPSTARGQNNGTSWF
ncbi:glycine-rich cell wall structural protein 1.8 [Drosophila miranda]|uniref:glycine-rich cell wall structural protein 1.8 n=1 Tax=Drosophila miranda TaxID=7229 RepID=UPI0007E813B6|nr:glycine-rich cell wall structural protein 1.8 [Drosophila miranda]